MQPYVENFFRDQQRDSTESARHVVPRILELVRPQSLIDIGCGVGAWLSVFQEHGIQDFLGVDGDYVDPQMLLVPKERFVAHDLKRPYTTDRKFDLVVSLEVAEHLPAETAEAFVESLTQLGRVVLFSGAVPHQGGVFHINEQWQDYWARLFEQRGYAVVDCLRSPLWDNDRVQWWYLQNMLIYVRKSCLADYPALLQVHDQGSNFPLSVVHPKMYEGLNYYTDPQTMSLPSAWSAFTKVLRRVLRDRLRPGARGKSSTLAAKRDNA
jgi:SAM-dependent methyltransferase